MKCPSCKSFDQNETHLDSDQFHENHVQCNICGTIWSENHGQVEVVSDCQRDSFLESTGDSVECDDYAFV